MARNHPGYNTVEADMGDGDAAEGGGKRHLDGSGVQPTSKVTKVFVSIRRLLLHSSCTTRLPCFHTFFFVSPTGGETVTSPKI
jgi:hypothetical protein